VVSEYLYGSAKFEEFWAFSESLTALPLQSSIRIDAAPELELRCDLRRSQRIGHLRRRHRTYRLTIDHEDKIRAEADDGQVIDVT